jgi:hypothetical protein
MKVKSTTVYWIAAAAVAVALYILIAASSPPLTATYSKDVDRFGPDSVDMQMAMGTFQPDPPYMMAPATAATATGALKPLLLFPPSEKDLEKLSGPAP